MHGTAPDASTRRSPLGFREFVGLVALMMALNALAIDSMLPALPEIGAALHVARENDRQWIITSYVLGFGGAQLIYGPLSDRYGRRPVLLVSIALYILCSLVTCVATTFPLMLAGRATQGVFSAATRVVIISVVRDCYSGRAMARVMSLAFLVFLAVPIFAPSIGQLVLVIAGWRWIFGLLTIAGAAAFAWVALRLPETLHPQFRRPISLRALIEAFRIALTTRQAIGYTLVQLVLSGALFSLINSVQQLVAETFGVGRAFPLLFAGIGGGMAVSAIINARIVERLGTRRVSHSALCGFVLVSCAHLALALAGGETLARFAVLQIATMFCFGLSMSNFGAMAMEPLGELAGTGSSVQGFITTVGGAVIGFGIAQQYNGSATPIIAGFAGCGIAALVLVLVTERGRLFQPQMGA